MMQEDMANALGLFDIKILDEDGNKFKNLTVKNALCVDGMGYIRDCVFNTNSPLLIPSLYLGLTTATPTTSSSLATIVEPTTGGYNRQIVPTWTSVAPNAANNLKNPVSWVINGTNLTNVTSIFVTDVATGTVGRLIAFAPLVGGPYTIPIAYTINVIYYWSIL